jgi:hypothetical protein
MSILIIWSSFRTNQLTFVGIGGFFFLMRSISRFILAFARRVARDVLDQLNILCVLDLAWKFVGFRRTKTLRLYVFEQ